MIEILPNWHPIFVHFSVALMSVAVLLFVGSKIITNWRVEDQLIATAYWNLWLAALVSVLTVAAGIYAFNTVDHDTPSHTVMLEHRTWALSAFAGMIVLSIWGVVQYRAQKAPTWLFIAALLVGQGLVAGTAWLGGELVYRHGLGVKSLPKASDHVHAAGQGHEEGEHVHSESTPAEHHHDDVGGASLSEPAAAGGGGHTHDAATHDAAEQPHQHGDAAGGTAHHHDESTAAPVAEPAGAVAAGAESAVPAAEAAATPDASAAPAEHPDSAH